MAKSENIKELLKRFQELWDQSLNGDYTNRVELSNLSRKIRDIKCNTDNFYLSSLTATELIYYRYAILLANYK